MRTCPGHISHHRSATRTPAAYMMHAHVQVSDTCEWPPVPTTAAPMDVTHQHTKGPPPQMHISPFNNASGRPSSKNSHPPLLQCPEVPRLGAHRGGILRLQNKQCHLRQWCARPAAGSRRPCTRTADATIDWMCPVLLRCHAVPKGQQAQLLLPDRRPNQAPLQSMVLPICGVVVNEAAVLLFERNATDTQFAAIHPFLGMGSLAVTDTEGPTARHS
jgi:hypothetical protein